MAEESYSALQDRLFAAARGGDPESVRVLVTQEPRLLTAAADFGESALHVAARHGQLAVMEVLVAAGQPVTLGRRRGRTQQRDGQTPLASAADAGQLDAMSWLLDRGAPVDDPHLVGAAAASGHLEAIHLLVRAGADPHPRWADGRANARTAALAGGHHEADRLLAELGVRLPLPPPPVVSDLP
ncbi:MAG: ankyrin repeat domain-containing protein, partial [Myxococcota bacterium]